MIVEACMKFAFCLTYSGFENIIKSRLCGFGDTIIVMVYFGF